MSRCLLPGLLVLTSCASYAAARTRPVSRAEWSTADWDAAAEKDLDDGEVDAPPSKMEPAILTLTTQAGVKAAEALPRIQSRLKGQIGLDAQGTALGDDTAVLVIAHAEKAEAAVAALREHKQDVKSASVNGK